MIHLINTAWRQFFIEFRICLMNGKGGKVYALDGSVYAMPADWNSPWGTKLQRIQDKLERHALELPATPANLEALHAKAWELALSLKHEGVGADLWKEGRTAVLERQKYFTPRVS